MDQSLLFHDQLLATKFFIPSSLHALIPRPRLTELLNTSLERPLTLVSAPAGFGKTTLLSTWIQTLPPEHSRIAWVSLDEGDNESTLFWRLCCKKKADLVELAETSERGSHYDRATPIQMAPLPSRHHFVVRAVVPSVFTQFPRSGRNDARTGIACGSYNDVPMGQTVCSCAGTAEPA